MAKHLGNSYRRLEFKKTIISLALIEYEVVITFSVRYHFMFNVKYPTLPFTIFVSFLFQLEGKKISSSQFFNKTDVKCLINLSVAANFETHLGAPADLFMFKAPGDGFYSVAACDC